MCSVEIQLSPAATINLSFGSGIEDIFILRDGTDVNATSSWQYAGTAVTAPSDGATGAFVANAMIIGFNQLFWSSFNNRITIDGLLGDGNNGIWIGNSFDTTQLRDIHLWPVGTWAYAEQEIATHGNSITTNAAIALNRPGTGVYIAERGDDLYIDNALAFGYVTNFDFELEGDLTATKIWADGNPSGATTTTVGVKIGHNPLNPTANFSLSISNLWSVGNIKPLWLKDAIDVSIASALIGTGSASSDCINIDGGNLAIGNLTINQCNRYTINVSTDTSQLAISSGHFMGPINGGTSNPYINIPANTPPGRVRITNLQTDQIPGTPLFTNDYRPGFFVSPTDGFTVGFGTTTASGYRFALDTNGYTNGFLLYTAVGQIAQRIQAAGDSFMELYNTTVPSGSKFIRWANVAGALVFQKVDDNYSAATELFRIDGATGNFGIGTTTPWGKLSITGSGTGTGLAFAVTTPGTAARFVIQDNGNVGIGTTTPASLLECTRRHRSTTFRTSGHVKRRVSLRSGTPTLVPGRAARSSSNQVPLIRSL